MKYFATLGAVCAIGLSALASQAQAEIYHFTQTGTIASGIDTQGRFGTSGADLSGQSYSATFTFDPSLLDSFADDYPVAQTRYYVGGTGVAEVTIDGVSYSYTVGGPYEFSYSKIVADPTVTGLGYGLGTSLSGTGGNVVLFVASANDFFGAIDLTALYDYTLTDADRTIIGLDSNYWEGSDFRFAFRPDTISLTSEPGTLAGVPEPTSWALMIAGFGLAGCAMRARRRAVAST